MPAVKNVEKKIKEKEGFDVMINTLDGKDVRGDKKNFPQWKGERQTKNDRTVQDFEKKFEQFYPGYKIKVLTGDGAAAHGSMKLINVRKSYKNED